MNFFQRSDHTEHCITNEITLYTFSSGFPHILEFVIWNFSDLESGIFHFPFQDLEIACNLKTNITLKNIK